MIELAVLILFRPALFVFVFLVASRTELIRDSAPSLVNRFLSSVSLTLEPLNPSSDIPPDTISIIDYSVVYLLSFLDVLLAYQYKLLFPKASYFLIQSNYNDALALTKNSSCNNFQANPEKELGEKMLISIN